MTLKQFIRRRAVRDSRGSQILEAALVLPLLFMFLMAIFWFGQAYRIYGTITRAAFEGARAAVAPVCATCAASANTPAQNALTAVNAALTGAKLDPNQVVMPASHPVLFTCGTQGNICGGAAQCDGSVTNMCVQTNVQLSSCTNTLAGAATCGTSVSFGYKYPYRLAIPYTTLNLGNITLPAQAQSRLETQ
jgi:Flp pilus assembly protein TadG